MISIKCKISSKQIYEQMSNDGRSHYVKRISIEQMLLYTVSYKMLTGGTVEVMQRKVPDKYKTTKIFL